MSNLKDRRSQLELFLVGKESLLEERDRRCASIEVDLSSLQKERTLLGLVDQVLMNLSSRLLAKSVGVIDRLVTSGLRITFDDQKLEFCAKVESYRGKTAVSFQLKENGREAPIMESYGGGVLVVAGVLLRAVVIIALGFRRVLVLDESLSHLSAAYIPNASRLLRKLCKELGFTILMVTHQPEFAAEADYHYELKPSSQGLEFKLLHQPTS